MFRSNKICLLFFQLWSLDSRIVALFFLKTTTKLLLTYRITKYWYFWYMEIKPFPFIPTGNLEKSMQTQGKCHVM